ncbi:MAG: ABC transporter ATP-binding protein [Acidobacteriota bacterium]
MPVTLEAVALAKSYGGRPVFDGLSLEVTRGLLAVSGSNGSGKTTLLKILASLLRPDSGTVRVLADGRELDGNSRRRSVGWAGPDLAFYDELTAAENLAFFRRAGGAPEDDPAISRRIGAVGLEDAARLTVGAFSTGMKQRLRIAFATLFDPDVILLDEPMTGLDAPGRRLVAGIVAERRERGAVVVASNDPRDLESADRIVALPGSGPAAGEPL